MLSGSSFVDIAQTLGTSAVEVELTYNHLQDETRNRFAVADYRIVDGVAVPLEVYGDWINESHFAFLNASSV